MFNKAMYLNEDLKTVPVRAMRDGYGEVLVEMAKRNRRIVVLCADLRESLRLDEFRELFPDRFIEVGIAEQNMMGMAAGLALSGKIPFVNSLAAFNPGRNWEQLKVSVCLSKANVKIIGGHSGFGNGFDGANQQMFEDLALTRVLPNLMVVVPADYEQAKKASRAAAEVEGAVYLRLTKPIRAVVTTNMTPFEIGKAQVLREGNDVSVFACGSLVGEALKAAQETKNRSIEVINVHTIKPLDRETIIRSASKTGKVVVAEEHQVNGGLGGAIAELLSENCPVRIKRVGMKDSFGESGEPEELLKKYGMDMRAIVDAIVD